MADQLTLLQFQGGQIIPTYYYWHPQIFSPSGITELRTYSSVIKIHESIHDLTWVKLDLVKWQKFKAAICDLTKKLLPLNFVRAHKSSNQSGSQTHGWILFNFFSILTVFSLFFAVWFDFTVNCLPYLWECRLFLKEII